MTDILVVEDRDSLRRMLATALASEGHEVVAVATGEEAVAKLGEGFDLVLTDLKLPGIDGLEVLRASRRQAPPPPVIVLTGYGTVATAVEAMKLGALDFLEKPVDIEELFRRVTSVVEPDGEGEPLLPKGPTIVGCHPRMRSAARLLQRVAPTESTVLLTGESGTGKELFARALHALSRRHGGPFVAVNCAAIPETLIENELFGHEKGAFTGAHQRQAGRFEEAGGGTLLLDEIGELSPAVQGKVLRVIEERSFERVGSGRTLKAEVRLVAATNRDLQRMVEEGEFRRDLYFRLEVFPIHLPPLRDRASDIPALSHHLLAEIARRNGAEPPVTLDPSADELLRQQDWPGNVRELSNLLERAVILSDRGRIGRSDLEPLLSVSGGGELSRLRAALVEAQGDRHRAAAILGVSYRTLLRRIREHDLGGFPEYRS